MKQTRGRKSKKAENTARPTLQELSEKDLLKLSQAPAIDIDPSFDDFDNVEDPPEDPVAKARLASAIEEYQDYRNLQEQKVEAQRYRNLFYFPVAVGMTPWVGYFLQHGLLFDQTVALMTMISYGAAVLTFILVNLESDKNAL